MAFETSIENRVFTLLTELQACMCEQFQRIADEGTAPELCFCGIIAGEMVPFDYGEGGMAWVRPALIAPMEVNTTSSGGACAIEYDVTVSLGVIRCAPMLSDQGELPTVAEQFEAFATQTRDMGILHWVISCCPTSIGSKPTLGEYTPVGPDGGVVGGAWTATWRVS